MGVAHDLSRYSILDSLLEGCQVLSFDWRYLYVNDAVVAQSRRRREELLGGTLLELYPGIDRTPMFAELRRCMEERAVGWFENEFLFPDGASACFELRIEPVPEGLFVLSLDVTARRRAEHRTQQQIERLGSLRAIDVAILGSTDFRLPLKTVLDEASKRLAVDAALVFLLRRGTSTLQAAATIGFRGAAADRLSLLVGDGVVGQAALTCQTVAVADIAAGEAPDGVQTLLTAEGMRGFCAVPLVVKGQMIGVLAVARKQTLDADDDWVGFLEALAGQAAMAIDVGRSRDDLQRAHRELEVAYDSTIEGWAGALELRDRETAHHTQRVTELTLELARAAGIGDDDLVHVRRGAILHDIGKMAIPDSILLKQDKLTDAELEVMKQHPAYGYQLLSPIVYLRPALDIPYCHHERWDGNGYPRGLEGEAIPLVARLFAVVDVWDALRSQRPYHESWSDERARAHLRTLAGSHLDPAAVALFLRVLDQRADPS